MLPLLKPREVAKILNLNYHTVLDLIHLGELEAHCFNSRFRVSQAQLDGFLEKSKYKPNGARQPSRR